MEHTECKDCELSNGDCGYHFKMDGITNYEIASLSACDRYGNCEFFKPKAKPQGDLISREALKKAITNRLVSVTYNSDYTDGLQEGYLNAINEIDNAPTVNLEKRSFIEGYKEGCEYGKKCYERSQGEWYYSYLNGWHCSICHGTVKDMPTVMGKAYFNFCPNCGADMRGGAE